MWGVQRSACWLEIKTARCHCLIPQGYAVAAVEYGLCVLLLAFIGGET